MDERKEDVEMEMEEGKERKELENRPANDWEIVALTSSAYAASPGPMYLEVSNNAKESKPTKEGMTSAASLIPDQYVFPPSEHENLPIESDFNEIHDDDDDGRKLDSHLENDGADLEGLSGLESKEQEGFVGEEDVTDKDAEYMHIIAQDVKPGICVDDEDDTEDKEGGSVKNGSFTSSNGTAALV